MRKCDLVYLRSLQWKVAVFCLLELRYAFAFTSARTYIFTVMVITAFLRLLGWDVAVGVQRFFVFAMDDPDI
jgi:hypothetical protein